MPVRTGYVRQVAPNPRHPQRFDIWVNDGMPCALYTLNAWKASLCAKSMDLHRAVTVKTMDGRYGEVIVDVELLESNAEEGAA